MSWKSLGAASLALLILFVGASLQTGREGLSEESVWFWTMAEMIFMAGSMIFLILAVVTHEEEME